MSHWIDGQFVAGAGEALSSRNPATGEVCWIGRSAIAKEIDQAINAAREAAGTWAVMPREKRIAIALAFADVVKANRDDLARIISTETGKPRWESLTEVDAMANKVGITIEALAERQPVLPEGANEKPERAASLTRYKPLGVLAVLGPFNFPGHLPNGHIVPALLCGNAVVFKPSEHTPWTGLKMARLWHEAGLPAGVLNVIQGGAETGTVLVNHHGLDGVLFTGSFAGGAAIARTFAAQPWKMLALEMGGNNPLVVWDVSDARAAAYTIALSAYLTAGQRCSCARRLIIPDGEAGERIIDAAVSMIGRLRVGAADDSPEPFMGPVISEEAANRVFEQYQRLVDRGGRVLVPMRRDSARPAFLTPGLVDVTAVPDREDIEIFGPLPQVIRVKDFDAAIAEANRTSYGLVAALISDNRARYEQFYTQVRAGLINFNRPTTGASSRLPFGGIGHSGNLRPSAYFAVDYCAYPVASLENQRVALPETMLPGIV